MREEDVEGKRARESKSSFRPAKEDSRSQEQNVQNSRYFSSLDAPRGKRMRCRRASWQNSISKSLPRRHGRRKTLENPVGRRFAAIDENAIRNRLISRLIFRRTSIAMLPPPIAWKSAFLRIRGCDSSTREMRSDVPEITCA